ncbi:hypothetical protein H8D51_03635 [bacterium]|nr:hypothetical protein [bacterium]
MTRPALNFLALIIILAISGCSGSRMAVRMVSPAIDPMMMSLFAEEDLQVAQSAMEADIKLLDGLLLMSPRHRDNRLRMAQLLAGYSLLFAEPEDPARAVRFYQRSAEAAGLALRDTDLAGLLLTGTRDDFEQIILKLKSSDREALFWWAFATGARLSLQLDDPATVVLLPRVESVMRWCVEDEPEYFFGGGLLFLGAVAATRPVMLGGDPVLAEEYFARTAAINGQQLWLVDLYRARYLCTATWAAERFVTLLENVIQTDQLPPPEELRLLNSFARQQAARLLERRHDYF